MIGSLIGAGIGLLGSLFGGLSSASANKRARAEQAREKSEEEARYSRQRYEDPTARADVQALLNRTQEAMRTANRAALGRQAVMGGTEAALTGTKEASAGAMANAAGQAEATASQRNDSLDARHEQSQQNFAQQKIAMDMHQAQQTAKAGESALKAAGQIAAGTIDGTTNTAQPANANAQSDAPVVEDSMDIATKLLFTPQGPQRVGGQTWDVADDLEKQRQLYPKYNNYSGGVL
mgnify:CR=1 FL=1